MATRPASDADCLEAIRILEQYDNASEASRIYGIDRSTLLRRRKEGIRRGLHLSQGIHESASGARALPSEVALSWRRIYDDDGKHLDTVLLKPNTLQAQQSVMDLLEDAFQTIPAAKPIDPPKTTLPDLLTFYPLFDVHMRMHAWGKETGGQDYDLKLAAADMKAAVASVMELSPNSETAVLLIGGDFFHADDNTNQTPASRHNLDVDGRHYKGLETGIEAVAYAAETIAAKHGEVIIRVIRGNHDEHSHLTLSLALSQRYRDNPRINVENCQRDIFLHQWGECLIAAHHGDRGKPQALAMRIAAECPFWSQTRFRSIFTGHIHHESAKEFPGVKWESLRAFCPPDAYGAQFSARRAMQAITFHKTRGRILTAHDPIDRQDAA